MEPCEIESLKDKPYCLRNFELKKSLDYWKKTQKVISGYFEDEYNFRMRWLEYLKRSKQEKNEEYYQNLGYTFWREEEKRWKKIDRMCSHARIPIVLNRQRGGLFSIIAGDSTSGQEVTFGNVRNACEKAQYDLQKEMHYPYLSKIFTEDWMDNEKVDGSSAQLLVYLLLFSQGLYKQNIPLWMIVSAALVQNDKGKWVVKKISGVDKKVEAACEQGITIFWVHGDNFEEANNNAKEHLLVKKFCEPGEEVSLQDAKNLFYDTLMSGPQIDRKSDKGIFRWILQKKHLYQTKQDQSRAFFEQQEKIIQPDALPLSYFGIHSAMTSLYSEIDTEKAKASREKAFQHRKVYEEKFVEDVSKEMAFWLNAYVNFPCNQTISLIDCLEYTTNENIAQYCEESLEQIQGLLKVFKQNSTLQWNHMILLNTKARVLNYLCRLHHAEDERWQQALNYVKNYPLSTWKKWKDMPDTNENRQKNIFLEFVLSWIKHKKIENKETSEIINCVKSSPYTYTKEELLNLETTYDSPYTITFGGLWLLNLNENIEEIYQNKKELQTFCYPCSNLHTAYAEKLWKSNQKEAEIIWNKVKEACFDQIIAKNKKSILHLLAVRPLLVWMKCRKEENLSIEPQLKILHEILNHEKTWSNVKKYANDFGLTTLDNRLDSISFAKIEARLPY